MQKVAQWENYQYIHDLIYNQYNINIYSIYIQTTHHKVETYVNFKANNLDLMINWYVDGTVVETHRSKIFITSRTMYAYYDDKGNGVA